MRRLYGVGCNADGWGRRDVIKDEAICVVELFGCGLLSVSQAYFEHLI